MLKVDIDDELGRMLTIFVKPSLYNIAKPPPLPVWRGMFFKTKPLGVNSANLGSSPTSLNHVSLNSTMSKHSSTMVSANAKYLLPHDWAFKYIMFKFKAEAGTC